MVNVSDALTWMRFTMCIWDIYHQVSGDTLPHRAINHAFGKNRSAGCGVLYDWLNWIRIGLIRLMLVGNFRQKQNKNSLWGQLSCFESLMVNVSDALTWMRFPMCIWGIYHQASDDTLPHMAINHAFGKNSYAGCGWWWDELNTDLTDLTDAMHVERYDKNRIKTPCGHTLMLRVSDG